MTSRYTSSLDTGPLSPLEAHEKMKAIEDARDRPPPLPAPADPPMRAPLEQLNVMHRDEAKARAVPYPPPRQKPRVAKPTRELSLFEARIEEVLARKTFPDAKAWCFAATLPNGKRVSYNYLSTLKNRLRSGKEITGKHQYVEALARAAGVSWLWLIGREDETDSPTTSGEVGRRPHVVCKDPGGFTCLHCRDEYQMNMPCPLDVWAAAAKAYARGHKRCRAPEGQKGIDDA